jgi:antitoxin YefM
MKTLPLSEVKTRLSQLIEEVVSRDEAITITRNGRPAAILVSPEEFESWKETVAIRSDVEFMKEIRRGLRRLRRARKLYTLAELFGNWSSRPVPLPSRLKLSEETRSLIRHLHPELKRKVHAAMEQILQDPDSGKTLRDDLPGLRSLPVGRIRIIYRPLPTIIEIVAIGPRKTLYEDTLRLMRREERQ